VNKSVIELRHEQMTALPPALAETLPNVTEQKGSFALVCRGNTCLPPIIDAETLYAALV
jgi:hypothetical protein